MYKVSLKDVRLLCYLGVYDHEQVQMQSVIVNLDMVFKEMLPGCTTDELEDVICYDYINETLVQVALNKRYKLIEHLAYKLIEAIAEKIKIPASLTLSLHKFKPVDNIGSSVFTLKRDVCQE